MIAPALLALGLAAIFAGPAAAAVPTRTPIEHFVVLMQENHSFDNYFGGFPGADGIPPGTCMPIGRARRPCVRPFHLSGQSTPDPAHEAPPGRMDGFIRAASRDQQSVDRSVMGHYDGRDLPFYWNVAEEHVLFDRFFAASRGGSVANHRLWVSGIFSRLERRGIPWRFYVQGYDPRLDPGSAQDVRVPVSGALARHVVDLDQFYEDAERGRLPAVAYVAPAGASEHPPGRLDAGETLTRSLVTALARSDAWDRSAFMWTYDEPGGWFDHVRPPPGRGSRVPALLVSAYARRGFVDSTPLDTRSIPAFIERNWGLPRRIHARGLASAFDFEQPPREPAIVAADRKPEPRRGVRLWVIYLGYGAALAVGVALLGWVGLRAAVAAAALLVLMAAPAGAQGPDAIQTVPPVPGMRFSAGGLGFQADAAGWAQPPSGGPVTVLTTGVRPGVRARFDRWYADRRIAAVNLEYRVRFRFTDLNGHRIDPRLVGSLTLTGANGRRHVLREARALWLQGNRVVPESGGTKSTAVAYAVEDARVGGSSVVHRGQQRFFPAETRLAQLRLLLFSARFEVRDALLGFPIGSAVLLRYPNGGVVRHDVGAGGKLTLQSLPRGDYRVSVDALGISSSRPIALSGDQEVRLQVISWLDIAIVVLGLLSVALALLYLRRPSARAAALTSVLVMAALAAPAAAASRPDPLFAYYYIWFNSGSWNRAKVDYPLLGRYSSDDRAVMARHVEWAKGAGIDGFIVSWKSTPVLNRRLGRLIEVADEHGFRLLVIYQGLDFHRDPLPAGRIGADLDLFISRFSHDRAFRGFGKPVVIWSGTPKFSRPELAQVAKSRRDSLHILASERNVEGYRRVAGLVDGNAYYWASVNPLTYPDQAGKLARMGAVVHARGGIWIPSAAPGFDARKVGGTSVVDRRDGATLRAELDAAAASSPDALGLISWNEFSENTHVEPSRRHGFRYLRLLGDVRGATLPPLREFDSSEPAATDVSYGLPMLGGLALLIVGGGVLLTLRR